MLDNHKASLRHYSNASSLIGGKPGKQKNMGSLMNTSSQFDKNASTTIDGTQVSLQHYDVSLRTDVDANDQAHNSMNLSLGKPTQSFTMQPHKFNTKKPSIGNTIFNNKSKHLRNGSIGQDSMFSNMKENNTIQDKIEV